MNLLLGDNIRRKRSERNLTQDEVASHLGVSSQAVSKWERGEGYPDIEMLPGIAEYFSISVDELLGTSPLRKAEIYDSINKEWADNNRNGHHRENVSLMRRTLRAFPNDALILVQLSTSLEKLDGTPEEKEGFLRESIAVQEQIIKYCDDCEVRGATLYNICFAYGRAGEKEKALRQAEKLPNLFKARENALVYFLEGEERRKISEAALQPIAWAVNLHFTSLYDAEGDVTYLEKARDILDIMFGDEKDSFIEGMKKGLEEKIESARV